MHKIEISATVSNADGTEYYYEAHRWNGVDDAGVAMMGKLADGLLAHAQKAHDKAGDKSARLLMVVDGGAPVIQSFSQVSKNGIRSLECEFARVSLHLIDESERMDKAHGKSGH